MVSPWAPVTESASSEAHTSARIARLAKSPRCEALVSFMFESLNRFAGRQPKIRDGPLRGRHPPVDKKAEGTGLDLALSRKFKRPCAQDVRF